MFYALTYKLSVMIVDVYQMGLHRKQIVRTVHNIAY